MTQFIYQANFNLTNQVTKAGFKKANDDLDSFNDLSETTTENLFNREIRIDISAKLIDDKTGVVTVKSPKALTNDQLTWISNAIVSDLEILNIGLTTETETISGKPYTEVIWNPQVNQFKAVITE